MAEESTAGVEHFLDHHQRMRGGSAGSGDSLRACSPPIAARTEPDDPLSALEVGDRPEPEAAGGLGAGARAGRAPEPPRPVDPARRRPAGRAAADDPRLRRAPGVDDDGNEVVVHAVIATPAGRGDETLDPKRLAAVRAAPGHVRRAGRRAAAQPRAQAGGAVLEEAACLPTAWLTAYRMLFTQSGLRPGDTVLVQGAGGGVATALIALGAAGRLAGVGRPAATRPSGRAALELGADAGLRVRRPAARAGRRRDGDRRRGDLVALAEVAAAGRHARRLRRDHRARPAGRAQPGLLPAAARSSARPWAPATSSPS